MATYESTQYTSGVTNSTANEPHVRNGVQCAYARFTGQALSSSDSVNMMTIPSGCRILTPMSKIVVSDLESSATVNLGYAAYTKQSDGSTVALDADAFCSAIAADSARTETFLTESTTWDAGFVTDGELTITLALGAGTSVAADTFDLFVQYIKA